MTVLSCVSVAGDVAHGRLVLPPVLQVFLGAKLDMLTGSRILERCSSCEPLWPFSMMEQRASSFDTLRTFSSSAAELTHSSRSKMSRMTSSLSVPQRRRGGAVDTRMSLPKTDLIFTTASTMSSM